MSPRWPSLSMSSCRMICMVFLFAPVNGARESPRPLHVPLLRWRYCVLKYFRAHTPKAGAALPHSKKLGLGRFGCWWRRRVGCRRRGRYVRRGCGWRPGHVHGASGGYRARGVRACGAAGEGHERDVAGALDGDTEPTLVARADASHAAREDFAALLHELREDVGAFVVDEVHLLDAELADFFLAEVLTFSAARTARTSARAARATFSARTTGTAVAASGSTVTAGAAFATRCAARCLRLLRFIYH